MDVQLEQSEISFGDANIRKLRGIAKLFNNNW